MGIERTEPGWGPLSDDLDPVAALAGRCLAADGGLPLVTDPAFLGRRYAAPGAVTRGATDAEGTLIAAATVCPQKTNEVRAAVCTAMVDPSWRGRGIGAALLDWTLATATPLADEVTVETEGITEQARQLFDSRGLRQTFAEDVMRFDLATTPLPDLAPPAGIILTPWTAQLAPRFFAAYEASFRQRPTFPGWSQQQWIDATLDDFRPSWSLLATDADGVDAGFVTCADGWIVQVGVHPDRRGIGLGPALLVAALRLMIADGGSGVLLTVNCNNPSAARVYDRFGFVGVGRRAHFTATS